MTIVAVIFWVCVLAVFHSYVLYPVLLRLFSIGKSPNSNFYQLTDAGLPEVYVIFSAYNEERVIQEKMDSIFNTTYPLSKLHVYIGSDNSSDKTNQIISGFTNQYPQLKFYPYTDRNGKSKILNRLVAEVQAKGVDAGNTVFVFTDANVMFTPATIYELAKHFKNHEIGQVGANILNRGVKKDGISHQEKSYIQRENSIKYLEGLNWGTMMGAFGACHAMRAICWAEIPKNFLMEDFYLSMHVIRSNYKSIKELNAICHEDVSNDVDEEFKRKTRIQAGNFQNLSVYWGLLFRFNAAAFCFLSHKVIRWLGPIFIILSYISNLVLVLNTCTCQFSGQFYLFTFVMQNLLLVTPLIDAVLKKAGLHIRLLRFVSYFYTMNLALVKGFIMYAQGVKTNTWSPTKRNL